MSITKLLLPLIVTKIRGTIVTKEKIIANLKVHLSKGYKILFKETKENAKKAKGKKKKSGKITKYQVKNKKER